MRIPLLLVAGMFSFGALFLPADAGEPTEKIKSVADQVLAALNDPSLSDTEREVRIRQAIDRRFNWPGLCRRCLARNWRKRTGKERKEFVRLFTELAASIYLNKFERFHASLKEIKYTGEKLDGNYALVKAVFVSTKGVEVPVSYKVRLLGNDWRIYDVNIEGVSLVKNCRDQLNAIIAKSGYEGLITNLKQKIQENKRKK